jgi:tRNA A37 threonylcarbamoyladenosine biosynthesis protein TsaE
MTGGRLPDKQQACLHLMFLSTLPDVSLIEWPQRLGSIEVPHDRLDINIQILSDTGAGDDGNLPRLMKIQPHGSLWKTRVDSILDEGYLDDLLVME